MLVDATAVETTDQLFDALVLGFSPTGAVVDRSAAIGGSRLASDYQCVEASAEGSAVACMWRDDDNVGIVLEMREMQAARAPACGPSTTPSWGEAPLPAVVPERGDALHRACAQHRFPSL